MYVSAYAKKKRNREFDQWKKRTTRGCRGLEPPLHEGGRRIRERKEVWIEEKWRDRGGEGAQHPFNVLLHPPLCMTTLPFL